MRLRNTERGVPAFPSIYLGLVLANIKSCPSVLTRFLDRQDNAHLFVFKMAPND